MATLTAFGGRSGADREEADTTPQRILIVGGGIGGLTLVILLSERDIPAQVIELAPALEPIGTGIGLGGNAMRVMEHVHLDRAIEAAGSRVDRVRITDASGRTLQKIATADFGRRAERQIAIHRARLHDVLRSRAGPGAVRFGTTVRSIVWTDGGVAAELSDGRSAEYDLLVGADGIHSRVRALAFEAATPRYAGYTCWRFVTPFEEPLGEAVEMWGRGRRVGLVRIGDRMLYGYATRNAPPGTSDPPQGRLARFRECFRDFQGAVPEVLRALESDDQLIQGDIEEVCLERWTRGHVVLLGDAAHAMTPNLGQGAAMAMEDAWVLAEALAAESSIESALERYEARRRPRVKRMQDESRAFGRVAQWSSPMACALRDALVRATPARMVARRMEAMILEGAPPESPC